MGPTKIGNCEKISNGEPILFHQRRDQMPTAYIYIYAESYHAGPSSSSSLLLQYLTRSVAMFSE